MKIDKDFGLLSEVRQIHRETRGSYGSRRTAERLRILGHPVGRYRAGSLMKKAGLSPKFPCYCNEAGGGIPNLEYRSIWCFVVSPT